MNLAGLQSALGTLKPRRLAIQLPFKSMREASRVSAAIEATAALAGLTDCNVFLLGETDPERLCVDVKHAQHYAAEAIIYCGRACECSLGERGIPIFHISLANILGTTEERTAFLPFKPLKDTCLNAMSESDDWLWVVFESEHPPMELDALCEGRQPLVVSVIRNEAVWLDQIYIQANVAARFDQFLHHTTNEECDFRVTLLFIGSPESVHLKLLRQRYASCIAKIMINGDNEDLTANPSYSVSRYASNSCIIDNCKRIGLIFSNSLTDAQESTRVSIKRACRAKRMVVIQICIEPVTDAKLENFTDCDAFCFIGCASKSISLLCKAKLHRRRIFTPQELLVGFGLQQWSNHLVLDHPCSSESDVDSSSSAQLSQVEVVSGSTCVAVSCGNPLKLLDSRSFVGVSNKWDASPSALVREGLSGIAAGYLRIRDTTPSTLAEI